MWLLLRPKAPISEHPSRVNVFRGIKHCWHDHGKTFINTCHWSNTHWVGKGVCFWDLKAQDSLVTRWLPIISILLVRWKKFAQPCPLPLAQQQKTFSPIFIAFSESAENSVYLEKKDQVYSLNIPEVSVSEKCGYLNSRKLQFQNTLQESMCSRVLNTADTTMEASLS